MAPIITRIAAEHDVVAQLAIAFTHGCRFAALQSILREQPDDFAICVIGADAGPRTARSKEKLMRERLGDALSKTPILFAIPEPSAEGWLQADLAALRDGVSEALGTPVHLPQSIGKYPASEKSAKARLQQILVDAKVPSLRNGLEYGPLVMRRVRYDCNASLERFVGELRGILR